MSSGRKGNTIQIYARVRPLRKNSKLKHSAGRYWITEGNAAVEDDEDSSLPTISFHVPRDEMQGQINHQKETFEFQFNKLFDVDAKQEEVFDVVAKPVVTSVMEGYNGTIFAYGQTGSGKTFTITGGAERYGDRGLIPRTLQHIFKEIHKDTHTQYQVHVSYLEIYNESGYDLLDTQRDAKKLEDLPKVSLQEDSDDRIHLRNLSVIPASNEEEALNLLFVGDTNRMIAETPSNPASSRSHCIFIISITSRKAGEDTIRRSKLHLVDLAGSERVSKTGIDGNLLKEARHINLSLHYLEQVIIALHEQSKGRRTHIPYRNSMMTSVLRDSLGGNCMTTMIAALAVEDVLIDESISTCRFAKRVALISNNATLNEEVDPQLMILRLKQEISRLRAELAIARGGDAGDDVLPDYEKKRIQDALDAYLKDNSPTAELLYSDFKKIQFVITSMKARILGNGGNASTAMIPRSGSDSAMGKEFMAIDRHGMSLNQIEQIEKLKKLAQHRDNEINILVGMIAQLKQEIATGIPTQTRVQQPQNKSQQEPSQTPQPSAPSQYPQSLSKAIVPQISSRQIITSSNPASNLKSSIPQLSTDKARAFEIFRQSYPASEWIDAQKSTLKVKYNEAKKMGELAHGIRVQMKTIKQILDDPDTQDMSQRQRLPQLVAEYKDAYATLKELKSEIEHLQHLLEQGRLRMTRDFEAWFVEVYQENELAHPSSIIQLEEAVQNVNPNIYNIQKSQPQSEQSAASNFNQNPEKFKSRPSTPKILPRQPSSSSISGNPPSHRIQTDDESRNYSESIEPRLIPRVTQQPRSTSETSIATLNASRASSGASISADYNRREKITELKSKWEGSDAISHKIERPYSSMSSYRESIMPIRTPATSARRPSSALGDNPRSDRVLSDIEAFYKTRDKILQQITK